MRAARRLVEAGESPADAGESPADAAVRETFEDTGPRVRGRAWSMRSVGPAKGCGGYSSFSRPAPSARVVLSEEDSEFRWIAPRA